MLNSSFNLDPFFFRNIDDLESKKVILRTCLNVTLDKELNITDDTRLFESLPGILELASSAKKVIILAHLGRPEGKDPSMSLKPVFDWLVSKTSLTDELFFASDFDSEYVKSDKYKIVLVENIRYFPDEDSKDLAKREQFAKEIASHADLFINDAFADYRESASTYDIAKFLPSYLGPLYSKEIIALSYFSKPEALFVAVLGGAKLSEKIDLLNALGPSVDQILVGGAMAYTLLKAKGIEIGGSRYEEDKLEVATEILKKFGDKILLPFDHIATDKFEESSETYVINQPSISHKDHEKPIAVDIGLETVKKYEEVISTAKSILWNGPMGVFEWENSSNGTLAIGNAIMKNSGFRLVGGGDTIVAINKFELRDFDHICTGGGAMLSYIAKPKFPTLDVIINK